MEPTCDSVALSDMMQSISVERKERLQRYRSDIDRKLGVYAEMLVRCMICMNAGVTYKSVTFAAGHSGKPFLTGFPHYEFSISHTRNAVAAAVSDNPVGVDVERIRNVDIGIAKRIYSEHEMAWLNDPAADKDYRFLEIWTKKEALVKYYGTGLTSDLKAYDVMSALPCERITTYALGDYIVSICSGAEDRDIDFRRISEPELVDMWRNLTV
jgi:4'-phosphopantetheinyl transferase